jgi:hypothetical protein
MEMRHAYKILDENLKEKRPLQTPRRKWEDNTKMGNTVCGFDSSVTGKGQVKGSCEYGNERLISHKRRGRFGMTSPEDIDATAWQKTMTRNLQQYLILKTANYLANQPMGNQPVGDTYEIFPSRRAIKLVG